MNIARRIFIYCILVVAFLLAMSAFTPTWAQQGQPMGTPTSNVYSKGMLSADSALRAAKQFKVYPYFDSTGELAVVGHKFYYHNGLIWVNVPDTASLSGIYFKKVDSNTHKNAITLDYFNAHNISFTGTPGSVVFLDGAGALSENNSNFFWDNSITRLKTTALSVGTSSTSYTLTMGGKVGWDAGLGAISHILGPTDQDLTLSSVGGHSINLNGANFDASGELTWPAGLGPILNILGPPDQDLRIYAQSLGNSIDFYLNTVAPVLTLDGSTGGMVFGTGLGPISHILGPTDQNLGISSALGEAIDLRINGTTKISVSTSGDLVMYGSSSGSLTIKVPSVVATYAVTMPSVQGAANTFLENDGSGGLTWAPASTSITPTITLTGDVSGVGVNTVVTTLASVGTAGTAGSAAQSPVITFDAKGRETGWTNTTITPAIPSILGGTAGSVIFSNGINLTENNSHLFWSNTNKAFGINTNTPTSSLEVVDTTTNTIRGIVSSQYNTGTNPAHLDFIKARGSLTSPSTIVTGDLLGRIVANGYDGTGYLGMADIRFISAGTISTNRIPTIMTFFTATDASPSVLTERMRIDQAGNVGIGTTTMTSFLNIAGQAGFPTGLGALTHIIGPSDQTLKISSASPVAITTSQSGNILNLTASNAVAGSSVAGASAGGAVTMSSGNAARLTSGNAAGGDFNFNSGTGIGTGTSGAFNFNPGGTNAVSILNTGGVQWNTSLGAITHILGPSDQPLRLLAGVLTASLTGQDLNIYTQNGGAGTGSAGNINIITGQTGSASTTGGNITLTANTGSNSGLPGGLITFTSNGKSGGVGTSITSNAANIQIQAAGTSSSTVGNITLSTATLAANAGGGTPAGGITTTGGNGTAGGNTTNGTGSNGGLWSSTTGAGGASAGSTSGIVGGNGGAWSRILGNGGAETANGLTSGTLTGGNAGVSTSTGGTGGAANGSASGVTHTGGNGSSYTWTGGNGGTATGGSGTNTGGNGGGFTFNSGAGGTGTSASGTSGYYLFKVAGTWVDSVTSAGFYVNPKLFSVNDIVYGSGSGIDMATSGGAAMSGTATLVGGTKTVSTTSVKAGDIIMLTGNTPGTSASVYYAPAASITAATSFVINAITPGGASVNTSDVSTVNWFIIHTH